jgi:hypothetical protein
MHRSLVLSSLLFGLAAPALAADEPATPGEPAAPSEPTAAAQPKPAAAESLSHKYQFGAAVRFGSGYRAIAPRNDEFCGEFDDEGEAKSICGDVYPLWLEISPSFGITASLEALVDFRIFLDEPDFTGSKGFFVAPGIKYYTDPEDLFKFFLTAQVVLESQDQPEGGPDSFDFGLRSALGLHFDLLRYLGLYAQAGIVFGFTRWISFVADFGGGVQVRY